MVAQSKRNLSNDAIAKIGIGSITAQELLHRLESMPLPANMQSHQVDTVKRNAISALIAERLLAMESRRRGIKEDSLTLRMRRGLEDLLIRDELFRRIGEQTIPPTEEEIYFGMKKYNTNLHVLAFRVQTEESGKRLIAELKRLRNIDSLVLLVPLTFYLEKDTITIGFGAPDTAFERAAFEIGSSRISNTFLSSNVGWVVLYLLEKRPNPIASKLSSSERRHRVERMLRSERELEAAWKYYNSLLSSKFAQVDSTLFNLLSDSIAALWNQDTIAFHRSNGYFISSETVEILLDRLKPFLGMPITAIDDENITLGDLLEMFRYEYFISPERQGMLFKVRLNQQVKQLVGSAFIAQEGRSQNLLNSAYVQTDLRMWTDYWAARSLYYQLRDSTSVSREEILQHLLNNKEIFGQKYEVNVRELLCNSIVGLDSVLAKLNDSVSFSDIAKNYSKRKQWAENGGESGFFPIINHPEIGFNALLEDTGKLVGPVQTPEGYSVFIVLGKRQKGENFISFEILKKNIYDRLLKEKQKQTIDRFIAELARREQVTINYAALKKLKITNIPMFTRRHIGFGGMMSVAPIFLPQWEWIKEFQKPIQSINQ